MRVIQFLGPQFKLKLWPQNGVTYYARDMSHLDYFYRLFPRRITSGFVIPIRKSVGLFFTKRNFNVLLGINTGMLGCSVKLPDEVCVSHTKRVGENKAVLQL